MKLPVIYLFCLLMWFHFPAVNAQETKPLTNQASKPNFLEGIIMDPDGKALPNLIVKAFDADSLGWSFLAASQTDLGGVYRILWFQDQIADTNRKFANIAFQVESETGEVFYQTHADSILRNTSGIRVFDMTVAYITEDLEVKTEPESPEVEPYSETSLYSIRLGILDRAYNYLGVPYKWAGTDRHGFDCSGFAHYIYTANNINIPRVASDQQKYAKPIPLEDLLPGDLIFFSNGRHVDHVGIVVANNQHDIEMIHASKTFGISMVGAKTNQYWRSRLHSGGSFLTDDALWPAKEELITEAIPEVHYQEIPLQHQKETIKPKRERKQRNYKYALGLKAGTYGLGGEIVMALTPKIHLRLGGTYMKLENTIDSELFGVKAENKLRTGSIAMMANWQAGNKFFFSGGAVYNMFENIITGAPDEGLDFGVLTLDHSQVEVLTVTLKPGNTISPYFGIGYGSVISRNGLVSAAIELGGVYHAVPDLSLETYGALSTNENHEQLMLLQDAVSGFKVLPVINFQLSFKLN